MTAPLLLLALLSLARALTVVPASDPRVRWVGRTNASARDGSVAFDYEGVSATITITSPWTFLSVTISDQCAGSASLGGGSRWLVTATPADARALTPGRRVSTFWSGPRVSEYYLYANAGGGCDPSCSFNGATAVTLTRLTESRISLCGPGAGLSVASFATDGGVVATAAPSPARRLEFIGDSISAGDLNDGQGATTCSNSAGNDDITLSSGGRLCLPTAAGGLGAECMYSAWGGITLGARGWGMRDLYPFTFSAGGRNAYEPWTFGAFSADAVVINLGTVRNSCLRGARTLCS